MKMSAHLPSSCLHAAGTFLQSALHLPDAACGIKHEQGVAVAPGRNKAAAVAGLCTGMAHYANDGAGVALML